jgi:hypothetical protein
MPQALTIARRFHVGRGPRARKVFYTGQAAPAVRIPRIARLMALAIRFDDLVRTGVVSNQAELARLGHVSRARITQIMNLVLLAPDIQETLLFLTQEGCKRGRLRLSQLQPIAAVQDWRRQRELWGTLGIWAPETSQRIPSTPSTDDC